MHGYVVQPFGTIYLLWLLLTSHSSLLLRLIYPPVRPHGISPCSFLVYPSDLRTWVTATFWASLSCANLPAMHALYRISVRRATISLSLLLACTSQYKPWESLSSSSVATPMWTFTIEHGHARHTQKRALVFTHKGSGMLNCPEKIGDSSRFLGVSPTFLEALLLQ